MDSFLLPEHVHVYLELRTAVFLYVLRQEIVTHILFTSNFKGPVFCMYHFWCIRLNLFRNFKCISFADLTRLW